MARNWDVWSSAVFSEWEQHPKGTIPVHVHQDKLWLTLIWFLKIKYLLRQSHKETVCTCISHNLATTWYKCTMQMKFFYSEHYVFVTLHVHMRSRVIMHCVCIYVGIIMWPKTDCLGPLYRSKISWVYTTL